MDRLDSFGVSAFYLFSDIPNGLTPAGIEWDGSGNIKMFGGPGSGVSFDTGFDYTTNKVFHMSMTFDFTAYTFSATAENVTDSGPVWNLGTRPMANPVQTIQFIQANGGLGLNSGSPSGSFTVFDDIQLQIPEVVPEPSALLLLSLSGLLLRRRRKRTAE
jgi:hypothetical protein